jgi:hypothetical protein
MGRLVQIVEQRQSRNGDASAPPVHQICETCMPSSFKTFLRKGSCLTYGVLRVKQAAKF